MNHTTVGLIELEALPRFELLNLAIDPRQKLAVMVKSRKML